MVAFVACTATASVVDAFLPRQPGHRVVPSSSSSIEELTVPNDESPALATLFRHHGRASTKLRMVEEDDDDDDDDEDEDSDDPLGNGVDSVAWLPSVIGAKGKEVTSASREVGLVACT